MRLDRGVVGALAVVGALLALTVMYVNYSNAVERMQEHGVVVVAFEGSSYLTGSGTVATSVSEFDARYIRQPEVPPFIDWLSSGWGFESKTLQMDDAQTAVVFSVRLTVEMIYPSGFRKNVLDDRFDVRVSVFGAGVTWAYDLGPIIADMGSPLRFTGTVYVDGGVAASVSDVVMVRGD